MIVFIKERLKIYKLMLTSPQKFVIILTDGGDVFCFQNIKKMK